MTVVDGQSSIVLIKPDGIELGIEHEVYDAVRSLLHLQFTPPIDINFDRDGVLDFWPDLYGQEFIAKVCAHLVSRRTMCSVVYGRDAVSKLLKYKSYIRRKYSSDKFSSRMHCSDSHDEFMRERESILRLCFRLHIDVSQLLHCER